MNIEFSDKYQPLFDILEARNIIKSKDFPKLAKENKDYYTKLSKIDTVVMSGGRDAGKTFAISTFVPIAANNYNHRILYTRQTMSSTDNSITEALEERMDILNIADNFDVSNKIYTCLNGKGRISITGQKTSSGTQTAKLKSLEGFSIFITDEAEEIEKYDEWKKVKRSMRAKDVQCLSIISFNPPPKTHWIYNEMYLDKGVKEGFNGIKDNVLYIHTTYYDNGKENMAEHNWNEYEALRKDYELYESTENKDILPKSVVKNYNEYKYVVLGGFRDKAEGIIYDDWEEGEFPEGVEYSFGLDFGVKHKTALIKVHIDTNRMIIYCKEELYKPGLNTEQISKVLTHKVDSSSFIVSDSAEKRLNGELIELNHNVIPIKKKPDSVTYGIRCIKRFKLIVDPESINLKTELNNYVWADKISETPVKEYDDLMDALRYNVTYHAVMGGFYE